jgi:predicted site-specific integrase-resolvase
MNGIKYVKPKEASRVIGVNLDTLRRMASRNEINHIRTDAGRYLFDISSFTNRGHQTIPNKKKICYARVSSRGQKTDLDNQISLLKQKYPEHEIIFDFGSGLNFKRKGLLQILDWAHKGELQEIVVTYKDRLCRFGFELIEHIIESQSNAKIVVLSNSRSSSECELSTDLLSIITVFSARMHGLRKYKKQIQEDKDLLQPLVSTEDETDDRNV